MMVDRFIALIALLAAGYLAWRAPVHSINDLLPGGRTGTAIYLTSAVIIALGLWQLHRRNRVLRWIGRCTAYLAAFLLLMVAYGRARSLAWLEEGRSIAQWPPLPAASRAEHVDDLTPAERADWGVRVAMHRWADAGSDSVALDIPPSWPFPADVQVARRRTTDGRLEVWTRAGEGTAACLSIPSSASLGADSVAAQKQCEAARIAPPVLTFSTPRRRELPSITLPYPVQADGASPEWLQYRGGADHRGTASPSSGGPQSATWSTKIDGPARASASIVGDLVLIGAHGTGDLEAIDRHTGLVRWTARAPNWIHQDAVSDGRVVLVGFGNKWPSFAGRAPSGVAAYALQSGKSLWTAFDNGSVMTSPVIRDSVVLYVTAAGTLQKRSINTGMLIGSIQLPGGVIMAPPVATGDTLAVALDENGLCAVLISTLDTLWCTTLPGSRMLGHASPTIIGGLVLVSGPGILRAASLADLRTHSVSTQLELLWQAFGPEEGFVGQNVRAFDLRDGAPRWSTRLFPRDSGELNGHSSGTAVIDGDVGLIVLPIADSLVAFDWRTGNVRWTAGAHHSRGAPLVVDGEVLVVGRDGVVETRDVRTGALACSVRHALGADRAGPARADSTIIIAALDGTVTAYPLSHFTSCTPATLPPSR